jgi:transposase
MRGRFQDQAALFSYLSPESRVPQDHPLRRVRAVLREVLTAMSPRFGKLYAREGRPSIPPEQLLSALLIQVFYGIRSERQLAEQLNYNLLYRWFIGLSPDDPVWDASTFSKNRDRLLNAEMLQAFLDKLLSHPQVKPLLSDEHFSVDGTLIEAWASHKSFRPKDDSGGDGSDFRGQRRKNDTHASTTDPESRLYRKAAGREARLCYLGHVLMENRHGLAIAGVVTPADGTAERRASEGMLSRLRRRVGRRRITVGEDKAYDAADHVAALRGLRATPHVARNDAETKTGKRRRSAIDGRTTRHASYGMSQSRRAMIECIPGWGKQHGTMRKAKLRGVARVAGTFLLNLIGYDLIRLPKLIPV